MAPVPGRRVCVYCASSTHDPGLLQIATEVGNGIARRGWSLVSGGGNVSMMGAVAEEMNFEMEIWLIVIQAKETV